MTSSHGSWQKHEAQAGGKTFNFARLYWSRRKVLVILCYAITKPTQIQQTGPLTKITGWTYITTIYIITIYIITIYIITIYIITIYIITIL